MDDPPAGADHVFDKASGSDTATVTVVEPHMTIVKKVDGEDAITAGATQSFTYDVAIANNGTSTAYDITVTDVVPQYVIVDPLSISDSGDIVGASATTGGGTITCGPCRPWPSAPARPTTSPTRPSSPTAGLPRRE